MLVAIFTYILFGMFGVDGVFITASKYIDKMEDKSRQEQLMKDIDKAEYVYKNFQTEYVRTMKSLYEKDDAVWTKELVKKTVDDLNEKRHYSQQELLNIRFKIKEKLTKEEWQEAFMMQEG